MGTAMELPTIPFPLFASEALQDDEKSSSSMRTPSRPTRDRLARP
jgi:hypothetical protein